MKRIYKYEMGVATTHLMPEDSEFCDVQVQNKKIVAWFIVDKEGPLYPVKFHIRGTGHDLVDGEFYLGTVQDGEMVWHLFWERN